MYTSGSVGGQYSVIVAIGGNYEILPLKFQRDLC